MNSKLRVFENVVETIGNTPIIKLNKIGKKNGIKCQLFGKMEFYNPGGSIKDWIGKNMIEGAEKEKKTNENTTFVECTSGNTGIGVVLTSVVKGYKSIITIPDKMSNEKIIKLQSLGAEVIVCPTELDHHHPESYTGVAHHYGEKQDYIWLDQYNNPYNPSVHVETTGPEIFE